MVFLPPLIKQLTEAAMQAELEDHLDNDDNYNRKNGKTKKTMKSPAGTFELETPPPLMQVLSLIKAADLTGR